jgi:cytochrome c
VKKYSLWVVMMIFAFGIVGAVCAASVADEAKALTEKGAAFLKANGKEKAYAEFMNPKGQFVKGELYLFVVDLNGKALAHGANPKLVGADMARVQDADGNYPIRMVLEAARAKGSGWAPDYKWVNPVSKKIELKSTYFVKVNDVVVGCGFYKG